METRLYFRFDCKINKNSALHLLFLELSRNNKKEFISCAKSLLDVSSTRNKKGQNPLHILLKNCSNSDILREVFELPGL